jgi:hypothetical protein
VRTADFKQTKVGCAHHRIPNSEASAASLAPRL